LGGKWQREAIPIETTALGHATGHGWLRKVFQIAADYTGHGIPFDPEVDKPKGHTKFYRTTVGWC
jgi:hypothetical protein